MYNNSPTCDIHKIKMTLSSNENYWYCHKCEEEIDNEYARDLKIKSIIEGLKKHEEK